MLKSIISAKLKRKRIDSGSDSEEEEANVLPVPSTFQISTNQKSSNAFVVVDTEGGSGNPNEIEILETKQESHVDKKLQELLSQARCGPQFEKNPFQSETKSRHQLKKERQIERAKNAGDSWFGLPATELTDEARADLELLQLRSAMDPLARYRRSDRDVLPKYFQVGRVVDAPEDFYSARIPKKQRKKTLVDELLADDELQNKYNSKYKELREKESKKIRGTFQRFKHFRKKKDRRTKTSGGKKK